MNKYFSDLKAKLRSNQQVSSLLVLFLVILALPVFINLIGSQRLLKSRADSTYGVIPGVFVSTPIKTEPVSSVYSPNIDLCLYAPEEELLANAETIRDKIADDQDNLVVSVTNNVVESTNKARAETLFVQTEDGKIPMNRAVIQAATDGEYDYLPPKIDTVSAESKRQLLGGGFGQDFVKKLTADFQGMFNFVASAQSGGSIVNKCDAYLRETAKRRNRPVTTKDGVPDYNIDKGEVSSCATVTETINKAVGKKATAECINALFSISSAQGHKNPSDKDVGSCEFRPYGSSEGYMSQDEVQELCKKLSGFDFCRSSFYGRCKIGNITPSCNDSANCTCEAMLNEAYGTDVSTGLIANPLADVAATTPPPAPATTLSPPVAADPSRPDIVSPRQDSNGNPFCPTGYTYKGAVCEKNKPSGTFCPPGTVCAPDGTATAVANPAPPSTKPPDTQPVSSSKPLFTDLRTHTEKYSTQSCTEFYRGLDERDTYYQESAVKEVKRPDQLDALMKGNKMGTETSKEFQYSKPEDKSGKTLMAFVAKTYDGGKPGEGAYTERQVLMQDNKVVQIAQSFHNTDGSLKQNEKIVTRFGTSECGGGECRNYYIQRENATTTINYYPDGSVLVLTVPKGGDVQKPIASVYNNHQEFEAKLKAAKEGCAKKTTASLLNPDGLVKSAFAQEPSEGDSALDCDAAAVVLAETTEIPLGEPVDLGAIPESVTGLTGESQPNQSQEDTDLILVELDNQCQQAGKGNFDDGQGTCDEDVSSAIDPLNPGDNPEPTTDEGVSCTGGQILNGQGGCQDPPQGEENEPTPTDSEGNGQSGNNERDCPDGTDWDGLTCAPNDSDNNGDSDQVEPKPTQEPEKEPEPPVDPEPDQPCEGEGCEGYNPNLAINYTRPGQVLAAAAPGESEPNRAYCDMPISRRVKKVIIENLESGGTQRADISGDEAFYEYGRGGIRWAVSPLKEGEESAQRTINTTYFIDIGDPVNLATKTVSTTFSLNQVPADGGLEGPQTTIGNSRLTAVIGQTCPAVQSFSVRARNTGSGEIISLAEGVKGKDLNQLNLDKLKIGDNYEFIIYGKNYVPKKTGSILMSEGAKVDFGKLIPGNVARQGESRDNLSQADTEAMVKEIAKNKSRRNSDYDLNCDGQVEIVDYSILIDNGQVAGDSLTSDTPPNYGFLENIGNTVSHLVDRLTPN